MMGFPHDKTEVEIEDKRVVKRITVGNFISNVLEAFNITRGGVYTVKRLLINPGELIGQYIGLQRYRITPPINVLIISTAIALILMNKLSLTSVFLTDVVVPSDDLQTHQSIKNEVLETFETYFNLILWAFIPIAALLSYWFNKKTKLNYAENLAYQTYVLSLANVVLILVFPLIYYRSHYFAWLYVAIGVFYLVYAYKVFFGKKWLRSTVEAIVINAIAIGVWWLITMVVIVFMSIAIATSTGYIEVEFGR